MKRILTLFLLVSLYGFGSYQTASAIVCSNCAQLKLQIPELAKATVTSAQSLLTQINTWLVQNKTLILDPVHNGMIAVALLKQQAGTLNLVTGALGGQALLQANPEEWIKNQGLNAVKVSLADITNASGEYSGSILASVVATYRSGSDLEVQLKALANSSIPTITQDNLCREENLIAVAKNDVMRSDGTYEQSALSARKNELYNSLCRGNPATDDALGRKLSEIASQRPDIGGWDSWLAQTVGGDNPYSRSVEAQRLIAEKKAKDEQAAREDLNRGGGVVSPSECKETVSSGENYGLDTLTIANAPCRLRLLTASSQAVQGQLQQALAAPMQKLIASDGWGILGTLSQLLSAKNTFDAMKNTFSQISSSGSGGGGSGGSNTSTTNNSSGGEDLANDPVGKGAITDPIESRLDAYENALQALENVLSKITTQINIAESRADQIRSCYQGLVDDFGVSPQDYRISPGFTYYQQQSIELQGLRAQVNNEQPGVQAGYEAISELRSLINTSNSSQALTDAYTAFEEKVSNGTLPSDSAGATLEGDYQNLKGNNDLANLEGGQFYDLNNQCAGLRSQFTMQQGGGF